MPETITSRANPLMAHLRRLAASGGYRREQRQYLCDSPKLLAEALAWHAPIETVVCTADVTLPPLPATVRCVTVPQTLMSAVSPMKTPQGVLAVIKMPEDSLQKLRPGTASDNNAPVIILDRIQDPGNLGTIIRTADAVGALGIILLDGCADAYSPKVVRASMGSLFHFEQCEFQR